FPVGTTTVSVTATDAAGNRATCSFKVTITYNFSGFFPPVENPPTYNTVKAGTSVPVWFSLGGRMGLDIFTPGWPVSGVVACDSSEEPAVAEPTLQGTTNTPSYHTVNNRYKYLWKTRAAWAGTCRQFVMRLKDGSTHRANFKFTK
ncbi:MAG TPA: PxKF domain-containing protein, partial [Pyrinomonadaceae bacterium]|nr:PxKF domain-containing protein [Pyrinomonadaceae bacterium]